MRRIFWLALMCSALVACGTDDTEELNFDPSSDTEEGDEYEEFVAGKADSPTGFGADIEFDAACETGDELTIASVGDVLLHARLQQQAFAQPDRYTSLWSGVKDLMEQADITYANLEGPTAPGTNAYGRDVPDPGLRYDNVVYTSYPMFNYHPALLDDLMESGVDVVSTANNHSLDRRSLGADRTIDELNQRGLPHTGVRKSDSSSEDWWTVVEAKGWKVAFLACTYGTNGIPDPHKQVLMCFQHADKIESMIQTLSARSDLDAVIVTPHWGAEYTANPSREQFQLAHRFLEAGAIAILGNHPHVIQPWERYVTSDGRETFVMYSHGNFVSGQRQLPRRSTLILYLGLARTAEGVKVRGARYIPLHMTDTGSGLTLESVDRVGKYADARQHVTRLMGSRYLLSPNDDLVTNPQCDPDWVAPHAHDGWVGGSCESSDSCSQDTQCDTDLPGGFCTMPCTTTCPDLAGRPTTFCVDLGDGAGSCVLQCTESGECREGYSCQVEQRLNQPGTLRKVCIPTPIQE